jgi:hypothetical protein
MSIKLELAKEFFTHEVTFNNGNAKWENYKHPENVNFNQKVYWSCREADGNLVVSYYLDKTNICNNHVHARIPLNKSFEEAVFEYWCNN